MPRFCSLFLFDGPCARPEARPKGFWLPAAILILHLATLRSAGADFVWFRNGDVLTGEVVSLSNGKLRFRNPAMGLVSIDMLAVSSIDSDAPMAIQLKDGREKIGRLISEDFFTTLVAKDGARLPGLSGDDIVSIRVPASRLRDLSGDFLLGVNDKSGNAEISSLYARVELTLAELLEGGNRDPLRFKGDYSLSEVEDKLNSRGGDFQIRYDNEFWRQTSAFSMERATFDEFRNLDLRLEEQVGLSQTLFRNPRSYFALDFGFSRVDSDFTIGGSEGEFGLALGGRFSWAILRAVKFTQDASFLPTFADFSDYLLNLESGLSTQIAESWKLKVIYQVNYENQPQEDVSGTDRNLLLTLGYSF